MSIKVLRPGLLTSLQDLGRYGYQKHGVIVSGGMDTYSLRAANILVGNVEREGVLEITLLGPSLMLEKDTLLAITGGDLSPSINGEPVPMWRPVYLKQDSILQFGACKSGCRAYLAVAGGYGIPAVMGSKSTYLRAGIGGFQGRALKEGDVLPLNSSQVQSARFMRQLVKKSVSDSFVSTSWFIGREHISRDARNIAVRVTRGNQFEQFTPESKEQFWNCPFKVTPQSDRMGYRLSGPALKLAEPLEMISEAVALGTIQVPPDGNPIILLADRQTAGGYPKIAQVAMADIPIVAQNKPGSEIWFQEISLAEAERLYVEREKYMQGLRRAINLQLQ
jgi:antagonist of KipI